MTLHALYQRSLRRRRPKLFSRGFWIMPSPLLPAGKFQMQVLPQCGHAVHEDAPDKVSGEATLASCAAILTFARHENTLFTQM